MEMRTVGKADRDGAVADLAAEVISTLVLRF